jgi:membrane associated rhomboid family serine protease
MTAVPLIDRLLHPKPGAHLMRALSQYRDMEAPWTFGVVSVVSGIFILEVLLTIAVGAPSVEVIATGLFGVAPLVAWPLSPVIHQGIVHFGANIGGLLLFGIPLEAELYDRTFVTLVVLSAVGSTIVGSLLFSLTTTGPIAYYGISGVLYALAGFAVITYGRKPNSLEPIEWLALLGGVSAGIAVGGDVLSGVMLTDQTINGGHASGLLIGLGLSRWWT